MNRSEMEDVLKIRSWGRWARQLDIDLQYKSPGWAKLVKSGYRETGPYLDPITDDEALEIDHMILRLPRVRQHVILLTYQYRQSLAATGRILDRPKSTIRDELNGALVDLIDMCGEVGCRKIA